MKALDRYRMLYYAFVIVSIVCIIMLGVLYYYIEEKNNNILSNTCSLNLYQDETYLVDYVNDGSFHLHKINHSNMSLETFDLVVVDNNIGTIYPKNIMYLGDIDNLTQDNNLSYGGFTFESHQEYLVSKFSYSPNDIILQISNNNSDILLDIRYNGSIYVKDNSSYEVAKILSDAFISYNKEQCKGYFDLTKEVEE